MKISTEKSKTMAFCGPEPIKSKIIIDNKIIQQINVFNYLQCSLSYEGEKDIDVKISKFLKITGLINVIFKPSKVQKQTRIQIYNTFALPTLLCGSENWTMKANDKTRITAAETRFMRKTSKYVWSDYKRNYDILKELQTEPVMGKIL
jgi:hypothetical protein